ncbi:MAG: sigma-70 family RNA polymerase sigma factor [Actinobacteria bacterium]|nr:MAG: sigma-70 family RNA polymerase sigma factor [Actinomycetota bacterium]
MRPVSTNELTDAELIIRTGDGDRGAFEVLYQRYARPVFGLALRRLGDRGRAEDAVQETFAVETPEEESLTAGPPERAEASWVAWRVHRALEELTPNERSVIELAYWSGLSQSEVAEYLGIPLGTVKTRTRAALARLAGVLEEELG